jgi:cephalosporin hydroxylase
MRRKLRRYRRGLVRRVRAFLHPPGIAVGKYRPPLAKTPLSTADVAATEAFHIAYYRAWEEHRGTKDLHWFGYRTIKTPMDMWIYQEIVTETRPEVIVECGTAFGGSALFFASLFDLLGRGEVVTIDIEAQQDLPKHPRISRIIGSSTDPAVTEEVRRRVRGRRTMVVLDSDHHEPHVSGELRAYGPLVSFGCYLVVEDTNVNGHPVRPDHGPGPMEAVEAFLPTAPEFQVDRRRERFMLTLNPGGFLKRVL